MRYALVASLVAVSLGARALGQDSPQAPTTFRAGVDLVQLDVVVLDNNRQPVRGLKASDFTVLEGGRPQQVVAFTEVDVPGAVEPTAPWMRDAGSDVTGNAMDLRRIVVIVMDDAQTNVTEGESRIAPKVARAVIDQLGPDDLAAVVYTYKGRNQNFTGDRALLRAAVDSFVPHAIAMGRGLGAPLKPNPPVACGVPPMIVGRCTIDTLARVAEVLRGASGRKLLVFISPSAPFDTDKPDLLALSLIVDLYQDLQRANISVYAFDPRGLPFSGTTSQTLISLAENTGGRAFWGNQDWEKVPGMFRENSVYYLLGYRTTDPRMDGRYRSVQVRVNRPGVELLSRNGYYGKDSRPKDSKKGPPSPIDLAVSRGLPTGDLPLRVSAAAFAVPGRKQAELAVVAAITDSTIPLDGLSHRADVVVSAFDEVWRSKGAERRTIEITPRSRAGDSGGYEMISRLPLNPGRYEVRVAVDSGGRTGSVFVDLDIPKFASDPLSMSGVLIGRTPSRPIAAGERWSDLAPIVPTTVRDFVRTERAVAFARLYQGGKRPPVAVTVKATVRDQADRIVHAGSTPLAPDTFVAKRESDYRLDLPLATLQPGPHLLTIEATLDKRVVRRDVRFAVK